ncbi:helix-turn-helix transcriptional regulator [Candidatus Altiarchaeota archaeon]
MGASISPVKAIGLLLVLIAVVFVFLQVWFLDTLSEMSQESCSCGDECTMARFEIPAIFYVGLVGICLIMFTGIYLIVKGESIRPDAVNAVWPEVLSRLGGDEKLVYGLIMDSGGSLFQAEIVEKTDLSKVKVTRVLDSLESRQLLERRRRGLTNVIVLK